MVTEGSKFLIGDVYVYGGFHPRNELGFDAMKSLESTT